MPNTEQYQISDEQISEIYPFAVQLGKDAGAILLKRLSERRRDAADDDGGQEALEELVMEEKLNAVDIVTKTDNGSLPLFQ